MEEFASYRCEDAVECKAKHEDKVRTNSNLKIRVKLFLLITEVKKYIWSQDMGVQSPYNLKDIELL